MNDDSLLKRDSDGELFRVIFLSHWSDIEGINTKEKDLVKWIGGDSYVGNQSGHRYTLIKDQS